MDTTKTTKKNTTKKAVTTENEPKVVEAVTKSESTKKAPRPKADLNEIITVYNGFQGRLVYISSRTKETFRWNEFGDTQGIELRELVNAKSSAKKFFTNNWFMFDEEFSWVLEYLNVANYYKNALTLDNFDDLFTKSPNEIEDIIAKLSEGQKKSVMYRAQRLYAEGEIDSHKAVAALERALGIELSER
jgi:hypothetical protein